MADSPAGIVLQQVANAMFPGGRCSLRIIAQSPDTLLPGPTIRIADKAIRSKLHGYFVRVGQLGGKAVMAKLTPAQRSALGRRGARARNAKLAAEERSAIARGAALAGAAARRRKRARLERAAAAAIAAAPPAKPAPRSKPARWGGSVPMTQGRHADDFTA
jgi:hypothetical protein